MENNKNEHHEELGGFLDRIGKPYILIDRKPVPVSSFEENFKWIISDNHPGDVANTTLPQGVEVRTQFLNMDVSLRNKEDAMENDEIENRIRYGAPKFFGTLVFINGIQVMRTMGFDRDEDEYETWEEAEIGHNRIVNDIKKYSITVFQERNIETQVLNYGILKMSKMPYFFPNPYHGYFVDGELEGVKAEGKSPEEVLEKIIPQIKMRHQINELEQKLKSEHEK